MSKRISLNTENTIYTFNSARKSLGLTIPQCKAICEELNIPLVKDLKSRTYKLSQEQVTEISEFAKKQKNLRDFTKKHNIIKNWGSIENFNAIKNEHARSTNLERYGFTTYRQTEEYKERFKKYSQEKYGVDNPFQSEEVKRKIKETCKQKYGVEHPTKLKEIQQKAKNTCLARFGVENPSYSPEIINKLQGTRSTRIKETEEQLNCTLFENINKKFGDGWHIFMNPPIPRIQVKGRFFIENRFLPQIEEYYNNSTAGTSNFEREVTSFIKNVYFGEVVINDREAINPQELDIYIPEKHLAIECNGVYWHSTKVKEKGYHKNKSLCCEKKGIHLIHIYEWEWKNNNEKVSSFLRGILGCPLNKIGARECRVSPIPNNEASDFIKQNSLFSEAPFTLAYGLYYKNTLSEVMSFTFSVEKKYNWEISNVCSLLNTQVIGGFSKIFNCFLFEQKPQQVFALSDYNKFTGKGFEALGMKMIGYSSPERNIVNNLTLCNPSVNNTELIKNKKGIYIIYGAGNKKFLWESHNKKGAVTSN